MPLSLPNDFANGQVADAAPVQENYSLIESYVSNHVIADDGTVGMQAPLLLSGDPTEENHAANKGYVDNVLPVGIIFPWPSAAPPTGTSGASVWLLCNGQSLQQAAYPELYGKVGLGYGTTVAGEFRLPNLNGRVMVGLTPTVANGGKAEFDTLGKQGGQYTVPLPQHHHTFSHTHTMDHNHGQVVSGNSNQAMTHAHSIAHDHPNGTLSTVTTSTPGTVQHLMIGSSTGTVSTMPFNVPGIDTTNLSGPGNLTQVHTHNVDLPNYAGSTGNTSVAGAVTSDVGVTQSGGGAVEHLFPYVTINFIIKAI
jgi:microcystin-dependent protein